MNQDQNGKSDPDQNRKSDPDQNRNRIRIGIKALPIWKNNFGSVFSWYGSRVLMTENWKKKYSWKETKKIRSKTTIYLSLLYKGRPSYRRNLQLSKENIQHFKHEKFLNFFYFYVSFLPSWIRIRNTVKNTDSLVLMIKLWTVSGGVSGRSATRLRSQ